MQQVMSVFLDGAFWQNVVATLVAGAIAWLGAVLLNRAIRRRSTHLLPGQMSITFDPRSDQYRRFKTVESENGKKFLRTFYVLGVLNESGTTQHGVHCFVTGVDEGPRFQEKVPLK